MKQPTFDLIDNLFDIILAASRLIQTNKMKIVNVWWALLCQENLNEWRRGEKSSENGSRETEKCKQNEKRSNLLNFSRCQNVVFDLPPWAELRLHVMALLIKQKPYFSFCHSNCFLKAAFKMMERANTIKNCARWFKRSLNLVY